MPEGLGRLLLVVAQLPTVLDQRDRVRLAVDVPGEVLGRPAELEQCLLEVAALRGMDGDGILHPSGRHEVRSEERTLATLL